MNILIGDDSLFLLHTIGGNRSVINVDAWMEKYIFPGGMPPSIKQIGKAIEDTFILEDLHNFGADYDKTLMSGLITLKPVGAASPAIMTSVFTGCGNII